MARCEFVSLGFLKAHQDWVTAIVTNQDSNQSDLVISAGRDRQIVIWSLKPEGELAGLPRKVLKGHSHFISDLSLTSENKFLLSSSWDHELRLWNLQTGECEKRLIGNEKEVFSVTFSPDHRLIVAGGAEKKIKIYNILGELKYTQSQNLHTDWISQVRFSPLIQNINPYVVSVGWDGWLKIWNQNQTLRYQFKAHDSQINTVAVNPSGLLIATGGRDKKVYIWNITDLKKPAHEFDAGSTVNQVAFHPQHGWIAASTEKGVSIWQLSEDRESKIPIATLDNSEDQLIKKKINTVSTSLAFDALGTKLYAGFADGRIRVWEIRQTK